MFPPIRPSPTIAISMLVVSSPLQRPLAGRVLHRVDESRPALAVPAADAHPQHGQPARLERAQVADRLRLFEHAEAVGLTGNGDVGRVLLDDLHEDPLWRPALVELAGGVQEAGAVTGGGGHLVPV